ncbi:MAG: FKBP-type peptidyl-prolyl cis-trans isomerase [Acidobacteriota bacterium]
MTRSHLFSLIVLMICAATLVVAIAVPATAGQQTPANPPATVRPVPPPAPPDVAAPPPDAAKTASGLSTKVVTPGTGTASPKPTEQVTINYTGWTTDGKMFDSSVMRGKPSTFPVGRVIPGFSEGLQLMVVGEKRRMWIPEALAYKGAEGKPKGLLVFDVELIAIAEPPPPPEVPTVPADVASIPGDAIRTASGLAWKELKPGTGTAHPSSSQSVTVHYSGWTTDGKMFDSSVARGQASTFPLDRVIAGWTEGVQLMVEGQKCRFWIPEKIAYKGQQGMPKGMLVFDVELIKINK